MSLLLDRCALLWFLSNDSKLSAAARAAIEEPSNVRLVSPASLFEIAIKVRIGKLPLAAPFGSIFPTS
jgi:PIN domain nuclease of toxin-antitoxin system